MLSIACKSNLSLRTVVKCHRFAPAVASTETVRCLSKAAPPPNAPVPAKKAAPPPAKKADENALSPITAARELMTKSHRHMAWGRTDDAMPVPVLPDDPSELAMLDPPDLRVQYKEDGKRRIVVIQQQPSTVKQNAKHPEDTWRIYFNQEGITAERWTNSLMGWTSNTDSYQSAPPLIFSNAAEAVYFAKKRGWKFIVKSPILRQDRSDNARYQDNFLPQRIAYRIRTEGVACAQWARESAGTSHYFRPLKYHGDGLVPQHGPNGTDKTLDHAAGYYKLR